MILHRLLFVAVLGCATLLAQAAPSRLNEAQARHLLLRSGFAPAQAEVDRLVGQNLVFTTDFRQLYCAIASDWWGVNPDSVVRGSFEPLRFLKI